MGSRMLVMPSICRALNRITIRWSAKMLGQGHQKHYKLRRKKILHGFESKKVVHGLVLPQGYLCLFGWIKRQLLNKAKFLMNQETFLTMRSKTSIMSLSEKWDTPNGVITMSVELRKSGIRYMMLNFIWWWGNRSCRKISQAHSDSIANTC